MTTLRRDLLWIMAVTSTATAVGIAAVAYIDPLMPTLLRDTMHAAGYAGLLMMAALLVRLWVRDQDRP